ncbi:IclR family transcriptional regulator C-terminal domain-containing protein [Spongiactinospora sp. 9N601]|uniref:IclR family transcriptional regulator domain-containing protein n=1 Tax=Spongiactinospora sp. 9N601 TaxID=3375149 RepID=UPI0037B4BC34
MAQSVEGGPRAAYVRTFDRGLDVLTCFSKSKPALTVSEVAAACDLDRAAARRSLLTLRALGYVEQAGSRYRLTARVLRLGYAALASQSFADLVRPYLDDLARTVDQSCSLGVFDGEAAVFVARAAVRRVMTIALAPGTRVPAAASAMGRALLSGLPDDELAAYLDRVSPMAYTDRTVTDVGELTRLIRGVRRAGWALLDQELEKGVRSIAVPVHDHAGDVVAAISIGTNVGVIDEATLVGFILPKLIECAARVEKDLTAQPLPPPGTGAVPRYFAAR